MQRDLARIVDRGPTAIDGALHVIVSSDDRRACGIKYRIRSNTELVENARPYLRPLLIEIPADHLGHEVERMAEKIVVAIRSRGQLRITNHTDPEPRTQQV